MTDLLSQFFYKDIASSLNIYPLRILTTVQDFEGQRLTEKATHYALVIISVRSISLTHGVLRP